MTGAVPGPGEPDEGRHRADFTAARRPSGQALALEHEAARMRAKLMDPETALQELAERLTFAHVHAGKPALSVLSEAVHYSKGTLSKVFAGKMVPSWPLVENLAVELGVPSQTVVREWFHLWTAANTLRRRPGMTRERATTPPGPGTAAASGVAMASGAAPAPSAGPASGAAPGVQPASTGPGYTCRACGSWVVDPGLHTEWHRQVGEAGRGGPASATMNGWAAQPRPIGPNNEGPRTMGFANDGPHLTGPGDPPRTTGPGEIPQPARLGEMPRPVGLGEIPHPARRGEVPRSVGLGEMPRAGSRPTGVPGR